MTYAILALVVLHLAWSIKMALDLSKLNDQITRTGQLAAELKAAPAAAQAAVDAATSALSTANDQLATLVPPPPAPTP